MVDPSLGEATFREDQAVAFEGALDRFLADCAAHSTCAFYSGGRPGSAFDALMGQIERHPVATPRLTNREPVGAAATRFTAVAPRVGRLLAFNDVECAYWPAPPVRVPAPVAAPGAPPILLVGSTGDPATPYAWAQDVARQLSSAVLVTRVGDGHTGYLVSGCVRDAIDAYLLDRSVPAVGLRCTR